MPRLGLSLATLLCLASGGEAADFPLDVYEGKVAAYLAGLDGLSVRITDSDRTRDGGAIIQTEIEVQIANGHARGKRTRTTRRDGSTTASTIHALLRPDGYYTVRERSPGHYILDEHLTGVTSLRQLSGDCPIQCLTAPVCRILRPLAPVLRGELKGFQLKPHEYTSTSGGYAFATQDTINGNASTTRYELSPEWLLSRYRIQSSVGNRVVEQTISYTQHRGHSVPLSVRTTYRDDKTNSATSGEMLFHEYRDFRSDNDHFSLVQFGIPEAISYAQPLRPSRTWLYLTSIAAVVAGLWVVLHRRRRAPGTPA